jgi:hypothetical protein
MRQKPNMVTIKEGCYPAILFETLSSIKYQYDNLGKIEHFELIAIVLYVATEDYHAVLTAEQSVRGEDLTM